MSPVSDPVLYLTTVPEEIARVPKMELRINLPAPAWDTSRLDAATDEVVFPTSGQGFPVVPVETASRALPPAAARLPGSMDTLQGGVTGTSGFPGVSRRDGPIPPGSGPSGFRGRRRASSRDKRVRREEFWGAMRDENRSLIVSWLSLPQTQTRSANVSAGSGSSL
jgi:hypothetical protein